MPFYDYKCDNCEHVVEYHQKITDEPYRDGECPQCGEMALNRIIGRTSFVLKGSGWYKDGYSSKPASSND